MQFNETLVKLRKEKGYTQEQLAEKLNVSRQAVARWESGDTAPDVYILKNLSEIFGVSADSFLNGTPPEPAKVEFAPPPEPLPEPAAAAAVKEPMSLKVKLIFAAVLAVILSASVLVHLAIIKFGTAWALRPMEDHLDENTAPKLSNISYTYKNEFWTAEDYEKWSKEQLEYYRSLYESGEKLRWHTADGEEIYRALTEDDLKSIEKSLDETLKTIVDGDLYTKNEVISWTAPDGKEYSMITEVVYVSEGETTFSEDVSDIFLTYDGNVATTEESTAEGSSEAGGTSFEELFAQYEKYGLEYREKDGERKLYFNGTPVSKFLDFSPDGGIYVFSSDGGGEISVQTVYNDDGELTGVEKIRG